MATDAMTAKFADALISFTHFLELPMERDFTPEVQIQFAKDNWTTAIALVIGYMIVIFAGSHIMKDRPAFDLRLPLAGWNALLCVFSFIGMCRTVSIFILYPYLLRIETDWNFCYSLR